MKQIDVITPFDFCKNCNNCKLQEIQTFADGKYIPQYECKYRRICNDTVKLYKEDQND